MKRLFLSLMAVCSFMLASAADNFVRTSGTKLLGRDGKNLVLRGTNCGNYMVREPYMMNTGGNLDRQFKFDKMIADICGEDKVMEFDRLWMDNQFGEEDMKFIADHGLNCLRVPMHYKYFTLPIEKEPVAGQQTWLDEGFKRVDAMCEWAEKYGILLILDMHACPGGQSSGDICDYDSSKPSLWESKANRTKLIALWRKLAERYKSQKCVAAYDLINETNWTLANNNQMLWDLTKAIIKAIREVDTNHIVIIEGNGSCNDYNGFPSTKMDTKMMLQYHHYWHYGTKSCIQWCADMGTKYNCPIYIGEFGENSNHWVGEHIRLYEEVAKCAAWTVWPMKKTGINSFLKVTRPSAYSSVISKYQNGQKPTATELWNGLVAFAEAQNISKCSQQLDYVDALLHLGFRKPVKPFKEMSIGEYVYCVDYDFGDVGQAYWDTEYADYHSSENGKNTNWNMGWEYRNDGVDIYSNPKDTKNCGYYVGQTIDGEWLQYTINNPNEPAKWKLQLRYALKTGTGSVRITVNDREVVAPTKLSVSGSDTKWLTKTFSNIILSQGECRVRIYIDKGGVNLNWFYFYSKSEATAEELKVLEPDIDGRRNRLVCSSCDYQGPWCTAELGSINGATVTWNSTTNKPSKGEGASVCIENKPDKTFNVALYQPIDVKLGHKYKVDYAVRGAEGNKDFWIQTFITKKEPVNYADQDLNEADCIGQLNYWKDTSLGTFDGMISEKAAVGSNHSDGKLTWRATSTRRMYLVIKVGTSVTTGGRFSFDNFTLIDETEATSVEMVKADEALFSLEGKNISLSENSRLYNIGGQRMNEGLLTSGIYIVSNGKTSKKIMVK